VAAAFPAVKRSIIFVLVAVKAPSVVIPNGKNPRFARRHASTYWTIFRSSAAITACKGSFTLFLKYVSARGLMTVTSMARVSTVYFIFLEGKLAVCFPLLKYHVSPFTAFPDGRDLALRSLLTPLTEAESDYTKCKRLQSMVRFEQLVR
jgi:hypothetical protein